MEYYGNVNADLLRLTPLDRRFVLEVGCGSGRFAEAYLARNPSARYFGLELFQDAAEQASQILERVFVGDVEQEDILAKLDEARGDALFDTLVFGDVLEHLRDPWQVISDLRSRVRGGGVCVACIPNVSHWSLLVQQIKGQWAYEDAGLLDRTHLRFFTRETAIEMFQKAGWTVIDAQPRVFALDKVEAALKIFAPVAQALGVSPANLRRDLSAMQWVIRAVNGKATAPITFGALGLKNIGGVTEARIDHPLEAVGGQVSARAIWGAGGVSLPRDWPPGVFVLHRQFVATPEQIAMVDMLIEKGWIIVSDMDDDPHAWREFVDSDFRAYRGVHAVTVSTQPLADMVRQWNPNVAVFPNAILQLPKIVPTTPKQGDRLRIFFGALNRSGDWAALVPAIVEAAKTLADKVEFTVVHDQDFYQALPAEVVKSFKPTLSHRDYMAELAASDIGLLPLADTPFNRLKSDLKLIECCAAGVVPICSPTVYGDTSDHHDIAVFAQTPAEWRDVLIRLVEDPEGLRQRRERGLDYVRLKRMQANQAPLRTAFYRGLLLRRETLEAERRARISAMRL